MNRPSLEIRLVPVPRDHEQSGDHIAMLTQGGNPAVELDVRYRDRRAARIENDHVRVTVLREGGHIAEVLDKATGVNPLWTPTWPSIEPSAWSAASYPAFGSGSDAPLLAGIMGHNLCLDLFGEPSEEEAAAGVTAHGEGSVAPYEIAAGSGSLTLRARLPLAQAAFERRIDLEGAIVRIREQVTSLAAFDRPIGWTQHVTLGPPFLRAGVTEFRASATRSRVFESAFGAHDYLRAGADFDWPYAPDARGDRAVDLRRIGGAPPSTAYTAHRMDPGRPAFFVAFEPESRLAFGYVWNAADFPWMGIWEEHASRTHSPWNGRTLTRGMEFGVSPFPESRRQMVERSRLFDTPTYRWLPARGTLAAEYCAVVRRADTIPESLDFTS
jgi:hypothetical protein